MNGMRAFIFSMTLVVTGVFMNWIFPASAQRRELPDRAESVQTECLPLVKFGQVGTLESTVLEFAWRAEGPWMQGRPAREQAQAYWLRQVTGDGFVVTKWKVE